MMHGESHMLVTVHDDLSPSHAPHLCTHVLSVHFVLWAPMGAHCTSPFEGAHPVAGRHTVRAQQIPMAARTMHAHTHGTLVVRPR